VTIRRSAIATALLIAAPWLAAPFASAQTYPVKPVRLVLPYLGGTDFVGRWLAQRLSVSLGQQVVIDPRPGAGGNIGHDAVAKAPADGYTLMLGAPPLAINPHLNPKLTYDPLRDFAPIAMVATLPNMLAIHPSVPAKSLQELVKLARAHPGKLTYGSGSAGSTSHLAGELLKSLSKTQILLVPYKGATFAMVGAMSGEVDVLIPAVSAVAPYVKDNRLRALAVLDTRRVSLLPDVPTSTEAGMPQLLIVNWYVLAAPAGTPRAIIDRLNAETTKAMMAADTRATLAKMGGDAVTTTPEQAATFLRTESERWGKLIKEAGIRAAD
jgi:tripartite-type tricarboxylate transporter receptor subunit TctC